MCLPRMHDNSINQCINQIWQFGFKLKNNNKNVVFFQYLKWNWSFHHLFLISILNFSTSMKGNWICGQDCISFNVPCKGLCRNPKWSINCFGRCVDSPSASLCYGTCQSVSVPCRGICRDSRYLDCEGMYNNNTKLTTIHFCILRKQ